MPSDANGVHSLPVGYLAEDGEIIQPSQHNPPLEDLSSGLTERLMRSGVAPMTGPLKLADGSPSAPSITFNSAPSLGFYKSGSFLASTAPIIGVLPIGLGPVPWSRTTAPPGWVLCYGQTLSRTAYPDLWIVAQAEIAAGNPMYNNGNGTTTFGIVDMRGRVAAAYGAMGGVDSGRLSGGMGGGVGVQSYAMSLSQLPNFAPAASGFFVGNPLGVASLQGPNILGGGSGAGVDPGGITALSGAANWFIDRGTPSGAISVSVASINGSQVQIPISITQPTMITSAILYAGA